MKVGQRLGARRPERAGASRVQSFSGYTLILRLRHSRGLLYGAKHGAKYDVHGISPYDDVDVEQQQYLRMRVYMSQLVQFYVMQIWAWARAGGPRTTA